MTTQSRFTNKHLPLMLLLLELVSALPAHAQMPTPAPATPSGTGRAAPPQRRLQIPKIGVDFGVFLPASRKARDRFGSSWGGIGVGIGRPTRASGAGRVGLDFSALYQKSGDHHAFVAPLGVNYRRAFNADDVARGRTLIPYYGVSADLVILDLRSPEDNVHSGFRLGYGGSALVGTTIGASGFAEAKYLEIGRVKGFDLSGVKLSIGVRF